MHSTIQKLYTSEKENLLLKQYNYEYSMIVNNIVLPTFIIPASFEFSRNVRMRLGDVCITSHPKSGSTWLTYALLLLLRNGVMPEEKDLAETFWWPSWGADYMLTTKQLEEAPDPRLFRSHMPYQLAVGGTPAENPCKYIYIARHPKDVVCSYYNYAQDFDTYKGPWEHFLQLFMEGKTWFGDWFDHTNGWWQHQNADNILFLWYEQMIDDFDGVLRTIADFLNYPLSETLAQKIKEETSFAKMKNNTFTNMENFDEDSGIKAPPKNYYRTGRKKTWEKQFSKTQSDLFDQWCVEKMKVTEFDFYL